jgi:hypothetical protein
MLAGFTMTISMVLPLLLVSLATFLTGVLFRDKLIKQMGFNMLISIDQFGNVVLLGDPDETISSRCGRAHNSGRAIWFARVMRRFVDKLFHVLLGEKNHCVNAVEGYKIYPKEIWRWSKKD